MKHLYKLILLCVLLTVLFSPISAEHTATIQEPLSQTNTASAAETDFLWPVPGSRHITSFFGTRNIEIYGYERQHTGIDISAATDAGVLAIGSGTVLVSTYDGGWGHYIIINHGNNIISLYAHLNSRAVARGETVTRGQPIGAVGNTGISSAPHLHFELRENGKPINPFRFTFADE